MSHASDSTPHPSTADTRRWGRLVRVLLVLYWLAMFAGTHYPKPNLPRLDSALRIDKILHFTGYMGLAALLLTSVHLNRRPRSLVRAAVIVGLIVAGYGLFDEVSQPYFSRYAEPSDYLADILGCLTGLALVAFCIGAWCRHPQHDDG